MSVPSSQDNFPDYIDAVKNSGFNLEIIMRVKLLEESPNKINYDKLRKMLNDNDTLYNTSHKFLENYNKYEIEFLIKKGYPIYEVLQSNIYSCETGDSPSKFTGRIFKRGKQITKDTKLLVFNNYLLNWYNEETTLKLQTLI
jgi:hypothetical protein